MSWADDPRARLRELERRARRRLGQHFLARPSVVARTVRAAGVQPGDRVVEIGPGLGVLTDALLAAGAEVTAIELDRDLAALIAERLPQVRLVEADATRVDWADLCPGEGWSVVANLPYNVGTGILMDIVRQPGRFVRATVMLQAEVVHRMVAPAGNKTYGALSVQLQARGDARAMLGVPPEAFVPPPKVHSTVVRVDVYPEPRVGGVTPAFFDRVVLAAFSQRRKTLRNSLRPHFGEEVAVAALEEAGIDPSLRAGVVDLDGYRALAAALDGRRARG